MNAEITKKQEMVWIYILTFLAARSELAGIYPFAVAIFVGAYLAGCGSWGLYGTILFGIASTFSLNGMVKYGIILLLITVGISIVSSGNKRNNPLTMACMSGGITMLTSFIWNALPTEGLNVTFWNPLRDQMFQESSAAGHAGRIGA